MQAFAPGLVLRFRRDAADTDFARVEAEVGCNAFAGRTAFVLARRDLAAFVADARALPAGHADSAQLLGGWEAAQERLRLRLTRSGGDRVTARVGVAEPGGAGDHWRRLDVQFVCSADAVERFLDRLHALDDGTVELDASLEGEPDAAA